MSKCYRARLMIPSLKNLAKSVLAALRSAHDPLRPGLGARLTVKVSIICRLMYCCELHCLSSAGVGDGSVECQGSVDSENVTRSCVCI